MELYIPPIRHNKNLTTGRYMKGSIPHNKGKKWDEWLSKDMQEKIKRGLARPVKNRYNVGGWNKKAVIMIDSEGNRAYFESAEEVSRRTGIHSACIKRVCSKERKQTHGCRFFWFSDNELIDILK